MDSFQSLPNEVRDLLEQLSDDNLQKLVALFTGQGEMSQLNLGNAKGFQVEVSGGTAYIGDQYHVDSATLEQALEKLLRDRQLRSPIGIPNNLPRSGVVQFVGRDQKLQELHAQLQQNDRIAITAIAGMGGIGKTELALQYGLIQLQLGTYSGGICWLRAREQDIASQILTFAQTQLGLTPPEQLDLDGQISYCWRNWPAGEVLIVLDDVTDYKAIESCLLPADPRFKLLITTRLKLGSTVRDFSIEELDEDSAIALLESFASQERIQSQLDDVKVLCKQIQ